VVILDCVSAGREFFGIQRGPVGIKGIIFEHIKFTTGEHLVSVPRIGWGSPSMPLIIADTGQSKLIKFDKKENEEPCIGTASWSSVARQSQ
jgi:hypothetical protein